jgi:chemotaxis methyl-accepting protein methylase
MRADEINFNSAFDLAFCCTFLQHTNIETKKKLFPRVQKALKPDGIWVFQEKDDVETSTTFLKENWIKFTEQFGFKIVRTTPEGDGRNGFVFKVVK